MTKPVLKLDWCSHAAAKYAVEHWHYSGKMPVGKMVKIGVWEDAKFIGAVVFAQGNNQYQGDAFGLTMHEVCELVRVALDSHKTNVTRIVAVSLRFLKQQSPGLRLVLSYADPGQGHHGGIYQGGNWFYVGTGGSHEAYYLPNGKRVHSRVVSKTGVKGQFCRSVPSLRSCDLIRLPLKPKFKYLYALDDEMRAQIAPLAKPYPKRPRAESIVDDAPTFHGGEDGSQPISALHDESRAALASAVT